VGNSVADGEMSSEPAILHLKTREMLADGVVPTDTALIDESANRSGGERFGRGAHLEERRCVDPYGLIELLHSEALGICDSRAFNESNRYTDVAPIGSDPLDVLVQTG
jgi:hypothetical protein